MPGSVNNCTLESAKPKISFLTDHDLQAKRDRARVGVDLKSNPVSRMMGISETPFSSLQE